MELGGGGVGGSRRVLETVEKGRRSTGGWTPVRETSVEDGGVGEEGSRVSFPVEGSVSLSRAVSETTGVTTGECREESNSN